MPEAESSVFAVDGQPIDPRISLQATQWLVALQADPVEPTTRQQWERWLGDHPDHQRAWAHLESVVGAIGHIPPALAHGALAPERRGRRTALKGLLLVAAAGATWETSRRYAPQWYADHATGTGERSRIVLADGSVVVLNARSAMNVAFDSEARSLSLLSGDILVTTAAKSAGNVDTRPFYVTTRHGRMQALGTRFGVHRFENHTQLSVYDGTVRIQPAQAPDVSIVVRPGEQTRFDAHHIASPEPVDGDSPAWTRGALVAHNMPLAAFIEELSRYRHGYLRCAPDVAGVMISGVFQLADTDHVLAMLCGAYPLEIAGPSRYWLTVRARRQDA